MQLSFPNITKIKFNFLHSKFKSTTKLWNQNKKFPVYAKMCPRYTTRIFPTKETKHGTAKFVLTAEDAAVVDDAGVNGTRVDEEGGGTVVLIEFRSTYMYRISILSFALIW